MELAWFAASTGARRRTRRASSTLPVGVHADRFHIHRTAVGLLLEVVSAAAMRASP